MEENNLYNTSLVPINNNALIKVSNSIAITNKLFTEMAEFYFNKFRGIIEEDNFFGGWRPEEMLFYLNRAIECNPNVVEYYLERASLSYSNDIARIEDYTKSIELDNNCVEAYVGRGYSKVQLKDYEGAFQDYSRAIVIDDKNVSAYINRISLYKIVKDYPGALQDYAKIIPLDSGTEYYFERIDLKSEMGDLTGALKDIDYFIEIDSCPPYYYYSIRAELKGKMNDFSGMIGDYSKAIELALKEDEIINKTIASLYIARSESRKKVGDLIGAEQDQEKVREIENAI